MRNGTRRPERALVGAKRARGPLGQLGAWSDALARQTRQHPGRTVALTFGAGFILGGGLFSPLTARLVAVGVRLGLRLLVLPLVAEGLGTLVGDASAKQEQETGT
jgi:hypothetical protein